MSEDLQPYGYRGLSHALAAQLTVTDDQMQPLARRPRSKTQHFKTHWYCAACLKQWDIDVSQLHRTQLLEPATRAEIKCEECGTLTKGWLIHETEEVTRLKQASYRDQSQLPDNQSWSLPPPCPEQ